MTHGSTITKTTTAKPFCVTGISAPDSKLARDVGRQAFVPYTADYYFLHTDTDR